MGNALVLIQGINTKLYIKTALRNSDFDIKQYDKVIQINTEEIFDAFSPNIRLWDKYGDILKFYLSKKRRQAVCRKVSSTLRNLNKNYDNVDILSHSLGTCIALTSKGHCRSLYMFGSPLSFCIPLFGWWVRRHTRKFMKGFSAEDISYYWSPEDKVCNHMGPSVNKVLGAVTRYVKGLKSTSDHNLLDYLNAMQDSTTYHTYTGPGANDSTRYVPRMRETQSAAEDHKNESA